MLPSSSQLPSHWEPARELQTSAKQSSCHKIQTAPSVDCCFYVPLVSWLCLGCLQCSQSMYFPVLKRMCGTIMRWNLYHALRKAWEICNVIQLWSALALMLVMWAMEKLAGSPYPISNMVKEFVSIPPSEQQSTIHCRYEIKSEAEFPLCRIWSAVAMTITFVDSSLHPRAHCNRQPWHHLFPMKVPDLEISGGEAKGCSKHLHLPPTLGQLAWGWRHLPGAWVLNSSGSTLENCSATCLVG